MKPLNTIGPSVDQQPLAANIETLYREFGRISDEIVKIDADNFQALTASKLHTARTIQISGVLAGSATFDGSANINIALTDPNNLNTRVGGAETRLTAVEAKNTQQDTEISNIKSGTTAVGYSTYHGCSSLASGTNLDTLHAWSGTSGFRRYRAMGTDFRNCNFPSALVSVDTGYTESVVENFSVLSNMAYQLAYHPYNPALATFRRNYVNGTWGSWYIDNQSGVSIKNATTTTVPNMTIDASTGEIKRTTHANSSIRFKDDVQPLPNALDKVTQIEPVTYIHKDDTDRKVQLGVIAEQLVDICPELVFDIEGDGSLDGVFYDRMVVLLAKAIQEQQELIKDLQNQINELKGGQ